ncbi:MAG: LacI family DNA-binding transcriptional regulator [Verrucomicrobiota bacterium]|nr:LacI family DNA-binding transcriptional regulator [Verrucomicrobiota bacterium]
MPQERVSIKDIARQAGVSVGTVSQALRTVGSTSSKTVERIRLIADQMGYKPNPLLASLARTHFKSTPSDDRIPIAILVQDSKDRPPDVPDFDIRITATQNLAERMGYSLIAANYDQVTNFKSYARQLYYKGVQGIIFSPQSVPNLDQFFEADWSHFRMVVCCSDPRLVHYSQIDGNKYDTVQRAWQEVRALGYQRIGFALMSHTPVHYDDHLRYAAAVACQRTVPNEAHIPILDCPLYDEAAFLRWYRTHRPDVVVGFHIRLAYWLMDAGFSIPDDVSFACLHHTLNPADYSFMEAGINSFEDRVAAMSVTLMDQLIRHHTMGIVNEPVRVLLHPTWSAGVSCPQKR